MNDNEQYNVIPMIEKGCITLHSLSESGGEAGISELAKATGFSKSTIYRILYTFQKWGFVSQNQINERYRLGHFMLKAGDQVKEGIDLRKTAYPIMENLKSKIGETINLGVPYEKKILILENVKGENSLLASGLEPVFPLYCSGMGKLILSEYSKEELKRYFEEEQIEEKTINTITSFESMYEELKTIREKGYSLDEEEYEYGLLCVAAPIKDSSGKVIAAVSTSGPMSRMLRVKGLSNIITEVLDAAKSIEENMGYTR